MFTFTTDQRLETSCCDIQWLSFMDLMAPKCAKRQTFNFRLPSEAHERLSLSSLFSARFKPLWSIRIVSAFLPTYILRRHEWWKESLVSAILTVFLTVCYGNVVNSSVKTGWFMWRREHILWGLIMIRCKAVYTMLSKKKKMPLNAYLTWCKHSRIFRGILK